MAKPQPLERKFWRYVSPEPMTGCWLWAGGIGGEGYGAVQHLGKALRASRVSWTLAFGEVPAGMHVLHRCDVRHCVNPDHLFLGTHADNMRDMGRKGRGFLNVRGHLRSQGEKNPIAKLTVPDVIAIRRASAVGTKQKLIAREFGVTVSTIKHVVSRRSWRHIL